MALISCRLNVIETWAVGCPKVSRRESGSVMLFLFEGDISARTVYFVMIAFLLLSRNWLAVSFVSISLF